MCEHTSKDDCGGSNVDFTPEQIRIFNSHMRNNRPREKRIRHAAVNSSSRGSVPFGDDRVGEYEIAKTGIRSIILEAIDGRVDVRPPSASVFAAKPACGERGPPALVPGFSS